MGSTKTELVLLGALAVLVLYSMVRAISSPLRHIPGPFVARFTKLWYLYAIWRGDAEKRIINLHRMHARPGEFYAPVIRLGPNLYSLSKPDKSVYGIKSKMPKSSWYEGWKHPHPERWTLFTDRDNKRHGQTRRLVANMYAMSALVSYEKYVDECTGIFQARLDEIASLGQYVDMAHWFQCYAFDMIGNVTYGKRYGFLDVGNDIGNTMRALDRAMYYGTLVGVYAWAHPFLYNILEYFPSSGAAGRSYLMRFANNIIADRKIQRREASYNGHTLEEKGQDATEDFLDKILHMRDDEKKGVTDYHVLSMSLSNIFAGSDTTAVTLSGILYHLIRTPHAMQTLRDEIEAFSPRNADLTDSVSFKVSQDMKYLQACIKEGLRMHSATGLPMWRVVDGEGAEACGQFFPPGTEVGTCAWTAHFDEHAYGNDVASFRPERWLDVQSDETRMKLMDANYMPFGLGSRTCIGRHISHLEISKLLPSIVRNYDFELEQLDKAWTTHNSWFVRPMDFYVLVKKRLVF
ncbi:putative P450 monooxygenase [Dendryphion nanum]|uniref:P450 monooxygenase n=1 Tax=Dendryphion nanum TaxID=256645 RepID=A0A9P9IXS8_9PLEO|nr:putative P450 monooxygenase [Dendryphion nanum]